MGKITDGEKLSRLTTKGTLRKKRGQPRIDIGIEFVIYAKLLQISKGRKITMWKAWVHILYAEIKLTTGIITTSFFLYQLP